MNEKKFPKFCKCLFCVCLAVLIALAPLLLVRPKKARAITNFLTFDMLFSGVWANNFYPDSTTGYSNNIAPIRLFFDFYGGNGGANSTFVTVSASYYSTGGQTQYDIDRFTYAHTYTDLRSDTYAGGLLPDYSLETSGEYTFNSSGWFSLAGTSAGISGALICPMRIRMTSQFLTSSDDFVTSVRMVRAYSDELSTGAFRIVNRLIFYSQNGTCFIDLMQYFDEDSGDTFNSFSDNTFYLEDYVDYLSVNLYNEGYEDGYAAGSGAVLTAGGFWKKCMDILDVKIFGVFSISDLMILVVGVWLTLLVLKMFAGG